MSFIMKQLIYCLSIVFISIFISSCAGTERSYSASDTTAMTEGIDSIVPEVVPDEPEVVIPDELDDFVVTSQGGYGAYVKSLPDLDSERLTVYRDGTTFTGAYTDKPHWIMIVEDNRIVGYIHDENVSPAYEDYGEGEEPDEDIELEGGEQTNRSYEIESNNANNREIEEIKSWIQGSWYYSTIIMGTKYTSIITIAGDNITAQTNGELDYSGPYEIDLDYEGLRYNYRTGKHDILEKYSRIHYSDIYIIIDKERRRLKVDENNYFNRL